MLMGTHNGAIHKVDLPIEFALDIPFSLQLSQYLFP
jgi:hypothetical protein